MICKVERIKYFSREFKIAKDKPFTSHVYYSGKPADTNSPTSSLEKCPVIFGLIFLSRKEGNILHRNEKSLYSWNFYAATFSYSNICFRLFTIFSDTLQWSKLSHFRRWDRVWWISDSLLSQDSLRLNCLLLS